MPDQPNIAVVCLSGGMDSTSLLMHLLARDFQVHGLSFDYGQKHAMELEFLQRNLAYLAEHHIRVRHNVIDLRSLGQLFHSALTDDSLPIPLGHYAQQNMKATVVPNRNAIFASIAYGRAWSIARKTETATRLCLGVHAGDHAIYPDCRPQFYQALWQAFQLGNWDADIVELYLPYLELDKAEILRDAQRSIDILELDFDTVFANTLTSYQPDAAGRAHGLTGADVERILAFHQIGRQDPIQYARPWAEVLAEALQQAQHFQASQPNSS